MLLLLLSFRGLLSENLPPCRCEFWDLLEPDNSCLHAEANNRVFHELKLDKTQITFKNQAKDRVFVLGSSGHVSKITGNLIYESRQAEMEEFRSRYLTYNFDKKD